MKQELINNIDELIKYIDDNLQPKKVIIISLFKPEHALVLGMYLRLLNNIEDSCMAHLHKHMYACSKYVDYVLGSQMLHQLCSRFDSIVKPTAPEQNHVRTIHNRSEPLKVIYISASMLMYIAMVGRYSACLRKDELKQLDGFVTGFYHDFYEVLVGLKEAINTVPPLLIP